MDHIIIIFIIAISLQALGLIGLIFLYSIGYPKNDATFDVRIRMHKENKELFNILPSYSKMFWTLHRWSYEKWESYCLETLKQGRG